VFEIVDLQHYLMMVSGTVIVPLYVATTVCLNNDWVATSHIFSTMLFICGIATLLQATVGSRSDSLPVLAIYFSILTAWNNNSNARGCIWSRSRQSKSAKCWCWHLQYILRRVLLRQHFATWQRASSCTLHISTEIFLVFDGFQYCFHISYYIYNLEVARL